MGALFLTTGDHTSPVASCTLEELAQLAGQVHDAHARAGELQARCEPGDTWAELAIARNYLDHAARMLDAGVNRMAKAR